MKSNWVPILLLLVAASVVDSCYYNKWEAIHPTSGLVDACDAALEANYTKSIQYIISQNCISCHNASRADGNIVLETYTQVKTQSLTGRLSGAIQSQSGYQSMPPGVPLKDCEIAKIKTWITNGAPQ